MRVAKRLRWCGEVSKWNSYPDVTRLICLSLNVSVKAMNGTHLNVKALIYEFYPPQPVKSIASAIDFRQYLPRRK